jgi:XTP/dITP diphosphohydrolase
LELETQNSLVLADDSGLEVDALNGAPGVHSARFAALDADTGHSGNAHDADNNAKLLRLLAEIPAEKRTARFRCCIALMPVDEVRVENASPVCYADEAELMARLFDGTCEGHIQSTPASAMIRCLCRRDLSKRSQSWARRQRTASATARARWLCFARI